MPPAKGVLEAYTLAVHAYEEHTETHSLPLPLIGCVVSSHERISSLATSFESCVTCNAGSLPSGAASSFVHGRKATRTGGSRRRKSNCARREEGFDDAHSRRWGWSVVLGGWIYISASLWYSYTCPSLPDEDLPIGSTRQRRIDFWFSSLFLPLVRAGRVGISHRMS